MADFCWSKNLLCLSEIVISVYDRLLSMKYCGSILTGWLAESVPMEFCFVPGMIIIANILTFTHQPYVKTMESFTDTIM